MPLDAQAERFLRRLNAARGEAEAGPTLDGLRLNLTQLAAFAAPPPEAERIDEVLAAGPRTLPIRRYAPPDLGAREAAALVFFHGGGLVAGGLATHDPLCATIAATTPCRVIAVDYGLAPENAFPGPFDDALGAARAILASPRRFALDPARVAVGGDSAGAALAIHAALALRGTGALRALTLLCPALSVLPTTASRREFARGLLLEEAALAAYWRLVRKPGLPPDDPRLSPLCAQDLRGLPATVLHVADFDPLRDEGEEFAHRLGTSFDAT